MELQRCKIDICAINEKKTKGKGITSYNEYILICSGVGKDNRTREGVSILIHEKYKNNILNNKFISERIVCVQLKTDNKTLNIISVNAPEDNKPIHEKEIFYDDLQDTLDMYKQDELVIILGDFNGRVGDELEAIKQQFNETTKNDNEERLIVLCTNNNLRINNTFFDHKPQHKYTRESTGLYRLYINKHKYIPITNFRRKKHDDS
jgi:hypothetical protein